MTWNRRVRVGEARLVRDAEERYGDAMRLHIEANELFAGVGDVGGAGYALSRASLSAYGTEDYEEALRLGRAGYEAFSEVNHRSGKIAALCRIGFAALALGDVGEAQRTFRDALHGTLAALKLVTGALTAFLGLMLMRGEFVPGLSALDSSAQILSWAIVFGYAQQVFTRFVDQQAHNVLENVGGRGAAGDRPMARETA